ncbi:MAG: aromatic amino acid lyase [Pseudomonadota bacterium]
MDSTFPSTGPISIGDHSLDLLAIRQVAEAGAMVELAPHAAARMAKARAVVERHLAEGRPVYGLTRALGSQVGRTVPAETLAEFSRLTVLGRAHSVGARLSRAAVRATLLIRAAGFAIGGAGVRPELARFLVEMLNRGVHPVIPSIGSVGASDLCQLGHIGLVVIGEGEAELGGEIMPGAAALARAGLAPLALAPKEGLALCSANAATAARGALALAQAYDLLLLANLAAALSMEGFRANLSPIDVRVAAIHFQPGQVETAATLRRLLAGSALEKPGAARRLQDPLSFRCVSLVHGSLRMALNQAKAALMAEINGAGDNPLVLAEDDVILSNGNFHTPALALAFDAAAIGLTQCANLAVNRMMRLMARRLTDLPDHLTLEPPPAAGLAPMLKTAEALAAEIRHAAYPVSTDPHQGSDGIEDDTTNAPLAVGKFASALERYALLLACELIVAAQAVDRASLPKLGAGPAIAHDAVRALVAPLEKDRPYGPAIERVADELIRSGALLARLAKEAQIVG